MKITVSNISQGPKGASTTGFEIELPLPEDFEPDTFVEHFRHGLECMKLAGETWEEWALEHLTPEQRAHREAEIAYMKTQEEEALKQMQDNMRVLSDDEPPRAA